MKSFYRFEHLTKEQSLLHAISKKNSEEACSFSLALHTGEDSKKIVANRKKLAEQFIEGEIFVFVTANQTHSDHVKIIDTREMLGWESLEGAVEDCDALVTDQAGVMLTILTADCVPILLYDPVRRVVAAAHAGWKGTEAKIVMKTVEVMKKRFGSEPSDILAGIAPAIGRCCYEVGEDVALHFPDYSDVWDQKDTKYMLDLPLINKKQLIASGIVEKNIEMSDLCTACEVEQFFSYRKENGCSGRFMSMIGMKKE
ncbi:MAG: peptidoglycan editing factor PgeF [Campylobacterota bacterium]|nr:peptidoglycan editing factor PgeF [Campylobacterota bacterium]